MWIESATKRRPRSPAAAVTRATLKSCQRTSSSDIRRTQRRYSSCADGSSFARADRFGVAVAAVALALAIKVLFSGLGADHPFVLLPAAVIVSAWYGGRGPGLLAALIAAVGGATLLLPPARPGVPTDRPPPVARPPARAASIAQITVRP